MRVKLELSGLTCHGCMMTVKNVLTKEGAKVVSIDLRSAEIEVDGDVERYIKAIERFGYSAKVFEASEP
ncbi:MAG: heavy-metal-associated domain-containing protein [Archaeoglobi archaeon]|nr:heavy-metal-associated domain-containing protein [Archaeoglobi archaeon]